MESVSCKSLCGVAKFQLAATAVPESMKLSLANVTTGRLEVAR